MLLQIIVGAIAILLAAYRVFVFHKRCKGAFVALGLVLDRGSIVHLLIGALVGAAAIALIFFVEWSTGLLQVVKINAISALTGDWLYFIAKPFIEEFVFRCAILGALLLLIPKRSIAVIISAAIFGGLHVINSNAGFISILGTMLGGLAYGCAFVVAERVWFPLGLHIAWNYSQARVFGFVLSGRFNGQPPFIQQHDHGPEFLTGGIYGPEGGLIGIGARILVLGLIVAWIIFELQSRRKRFDQE
jgi:uncharacterized protein